MRPPSRPSAAALATALSLVAILAIAAALVVRAARPPAPLPRTAPDTVFSAERALVHVRQIARRPHPAGSADNARVRSYLLRELEALGARPTVQEATGVSTRGPRAARVHNVVARIPGTSGRREAVLLVAHYDGVGAGPAAADDGAGVATLLETVRALRAGRPLAHDVIVLLTDAEEMGLLGAAAFAREHPWAQDVRMILNFEARGTAGRSFMFETARGNLDVVRTLRTVDDVSASSLMVFVYRVLPNDTDLSELFALGQPAMNFAFIDGVERYHTLYDDLASLAPRSVQHHGNQALALARAFAGGPLPRPRTGDAIFFDAPFVGLVAYPEAWGLPLAALALAIAAAAIVRAARRDRRVLRETLVEWLSLLGATVAAVLAAIGTSLLVQWAHATFEWHGQPVWRDLYVAAVTLVGFATGAAVWVLVRRRLAAGAHLGGIVQAGLLTLATTLLAPGASYVFLWPFLFAAVAALLPHAVTRWLATIVTLTIFVPLVYLFGVAMGIQAPSAAAGALLVTTATWLLGAHLAALRTVRWLTPGASLAAAATLLAVGFATVRPSRAAPLTSSRVLRVDASTGTGWVEPIRGHTSQRSEVRLASPEGSDIAVIADSVAGDARHLELRVTPPPGTMRLDMSATEGTVRGASVDGRTIDHSRYRSRGAGWTLLYAAPPDSGVRLTLTVARDTPFELELAAVSAGLPLSLANGLPPRRMYDVPIHLGDVTVVRTRVRP